MTNFGAFVELDEGIEGLIHVSEFDDSQQAGKDGKIELVVGETYPMKISSWRRASGRSACRSVRSSPTSSAPTGRRPENEGTGAGRSGSLQEPVDLGWG
jgi:predicted RNA-binding protein with RPS1 domain